MITSLIRSVIRVLVVEDSLTVRKHLVEVLSSDPEIQVVGEAGDGKTAIELCRQLRPDVVTLDMVLPVLSGLAVTEYIMAYFPTPILIVSASTNRGDLYKTYEALAAGALEVLEKPKGDEQDATWERDFLATVKLVSNVKVVTHMRGRLNNAGRGRFRAAASSVAPASASPVPAAPASPYRMVAIGASTGGPAALLEILRSLPPDFPLPILVVIHIGDGFGRLLAEWLDSQSMLRVGCAVDGEALPARGQARVILAPPGRHLVIRGGRVRLIDDEERNSCRPSVDVFFESVARELGPQSIACLLTGMGTDGAEGLLSIRQAGGRTLAQNKETCTIFGMPQEAVRIGAAEKVVPLEEIAPALVSLGGSAQGAAREAAPVMLPHPTVS